MDEFHELHVKGELSEKGYLKETFDSETNDLKHKLTDKGLDVIKDLLKNPDYRKQFILMAFEEAKKHPGNEMIIIKAAMKKIKELQ